MKYVLCVKGSWNWWNALLDRSCIQLSPPIAWITDKLGGGGSPREGKVRIQRMWYLITAHACSSCLIFAKHCLAVTIRSTEMKIMMFAVVTCSAHYSIFNISMCINYWYIIIICSSLRSDDASCLLFTHAEACGRHIHQTVISDVSTVK